MRYIIVLIILYQAFLKIQTSCSTTTLEIIGINQKIYISTQLIFQIFERETMVFIGKI